MNSEKLEKQRNKLLELGVMEPEDTLIDSLMVNYGKPFFMGLRIWSRGWAYFTEKRLIILSGFFSHKIVVYQNITRLRKCTQGPFPIGIAITYEDMGTGEMKTDKISLMRRNKWINFLAEKTGITL